MHKIQYLARIKRGLIITCTFLFSGNCTDNSLDKLLYRICCNITTIAEILQIIGLITVDFLL
jgi:hypothetical protein